MRTHFWLHVPAGATDYRIMAIDPGTNTLGISILSRDLTTNIINLEYSTTLVAENMLNPYAGVVEHYGIRFAKLYALQNSLSYLMREFQIDDVVSESPYLGRFPQAFAALTEAMCMIRAAILQYNPYINLTTIDPATIKMLCGVSGKSSDKTLMQRSILSLADTGRLSVDVTVPLLELDEHSIDSIAAGYAYLNWDPK